MRGVSGEWGSPPDQRSNSGEITKISAGSGEQHSHSGDGRVEVPLHKPDLGHKAVG